MSTEKLITSLEKLLKLHRGLLDIAVRKTEIIKKDDIDPLNQIIKEEYSHLAAIKKVEEERQQAVSVILPDHESPSMSDCMELVEGIEREQLVRLAGDITKVILRLKETNYLNQQLIYHSLQFVNVSLNLLRPQQESYNYAPPTGAETKQLQSDGFFNSKA